jgi:hypothetical protein
MEDLSFTENKIKWVTTLDIEGEHYSIKCSINDEVVKDEKYNDRTILLDFVQEMIEQDVKYLIRAFRLDKTNKPPVAK